MKAIKVVILTIFLILLLSLSIIPVIAASSSGTCGDNASWSLAEDTLTISGTGKMKDYVQYTNGSTSTPWDSLAWSATSIVIEEGITINVQTSLWI